MQKNKFFCLRNDESITKFPKAKFPSADNGMLSKSEMEVQTDFYWIYCYRNGY